MIRTLTFAETASGATYSAVTSVGPGMRIVDVLIETDIAWTAATAALSIGDSDAADALCGAVDVTGLLYVAADSQGGTAWGDAGGDGAPYSSKGTGKLYPAGDIITAIITAGTPGGPTGITRVDLLLEQIPTSIRRASVV